ncbi:EamA family transporter [Pseudoteredinibacter isoporae]|uniref:Drug/metabolite transporter (DMT)-like permease n=1 Tax=Pseudoteredinibacter isoporae TaxID=570281 RepID=A0A7X0JWP7_9GAMM|nr:drug/metabolite transporter (DMT)-like permease [Pseudoteredinibacter isoporae]NHO89152.1 EamA family transporter [Pseudoteredinibacter isoporae]NIB22237.1 EamA family transporter [Pseudoteredinibacter isoporae]
MNNLSLYLTTVLIWGSTWIAITFQLGEVAPLVSVAYRFALAGILLMLFCALLNKRLRFGWREHLLMFLQGNFLFGLNYWLMYLTTERISSGLVAVIFAGIVFLNILNGRLFLGRPIQMHVLLAACIGICGIAMVFWPELAAVEASGKDIWVALALGLAATYCASIGNIVSSHNQQRNIPVLQANAFGMSYGALSMMLVAALMGLEFNFDTRPEYIASLLYLSVFGSIIAFSCYLTLVGRLGADKASYASLLFPVIALQLSAWFENFQWTWLSVMGLCLVLIGNVLIMTPRQRILALLNPERKMEAPEP